MTRKNCTTIILIELSNDRLDSFCADLWTDEQIDGRTERRLRAFLILLEKRKKTSF